MRPAGSGDKMRTTTDYISTYNTETGTTQHETMITLYTFDELDDDARARVVADFCEERASDPYFSQWFIDCYEREIWDCVRDLEKSITGARVQWQYNRWYSCDFDCEWSIKDIDWLSPDIMRPVEDNGYYASMDLRDAWNKHARKLNGLAMQHEYISELCEDKYYYECWYAGQNPENKYFYERLDDMRDKIFDAWIEELEAACEDVRNTIEYLLRAEWEYYTSEEYAREECADESTQGGESRACEYPYYKNGGYTGRVYYSDNRKWYTVDGEFYEQSDVSHECVSIVKAA